MTGWVRQEPLVTDAGHVGGDVQASEAYETRWVRPLDDGTYAVVSRAFYVADDHGARYLECQTEYLICTDPDDPGSSELQADYRHDRVDGEASAPAAFEAAGGAAEPDDEEWQAALAAMS